LAACGAKSDSNPADAEFLKVSAELKQTLPLINETLSAESPEGIWRVASYSVSNSNQEFSREDAQKSPGILDIEFYDKSQQLIIIRKKLSAGNSYTVFKCDAYRGAKSWELSDDTLSYYAITDIDYYLSTDSGEFLLNNNLSLVGKSNYKYSSSGSEQETNTIYAGVKVSDSIDFKEAQGISIDFQVSAKGSFYQLSDYLINPNCFSVGQAEGELEEYTLVTDSRELYSQGSSSFVVQMMNGDRVSAYKDTIVTDVGLSVNKGSYHSNAGEQGVLLYSCTEDTGQQDENCLNSLAMEKIVETNSISFSAQGDSLVGDEFEVSFSYSQD